MSTCKVKRTYGSKKSFLSRPHSLQLPSSPGSDDLAPSPKRKRPFQEQSNFFTRTDQPPLKKTKIVKENVTSEKNRSKQRKQIQLHFCIDQTVLRACSRCGLSYTKGAPDDEILHRTHCSRIEKGMEWGREEEREVIKTGVIEFARAIRLKDGRRGRIVYFQADANGKIGQKLTSLLETINLSLSSPALTQGILRDSKAYLFLVPSPTSPAREKIVGCVIAQRIETAMAIATPAECEQRDTPFKDGAVPLVAVDSSTGLFCHPKALSTPMGVSRLFVPSAQRRQGIAYHLLSAAAETFIHGCPLDPKKGQVAFTQPTSDGTAIMMKWGGGGVRIYEE
ncbi:hypothetical protein H0H93_016541 [Arthromyces matolae]|nr:hypothetical protein H0H93_016541 [Arthromyces matolae]